MSGALRELLATFDIGVDDKQLKHADSLISGFTEKLQQVGNVIAGAFAFHEAKEFVLGQIEIGSALNDTADRLGLATDELQKFQYAAKLSGLSNEEASTALGFLNKNLGLAVTGSEEAKKAFESLGIETKDAGGKVRPAGDLAVDIAEKLEGMGSQAEKTAAVVKIFGRQGAGLLPMFKDGAKGIRELYKEFDTLGGAMSKEFVEAADKAGDEIDKLKFVTQGLKSRIVLLLLPALTKFTAWSKDAVSNFIKLTKKTNILEAGMAALGIAGAATALKLTATFAKFLGLVRPTDTGLVGMLKTFGRFGFYALLIAGLVLVFEDLYTAINGGDSVIGDALEELLGFEGKKALIEDLKKSFDELEASVKSLKPTFENLAKGMLIAFKEAIPQIVQMIADLLKVLDLVTTNVSGLTKAAGQASQGDTDGAKKTLGDTGQKMIDKAGNEGFFKSYMNLLTSPFTGIQDYILGAVSGGAIGKTFGGSSNGTLSVPTTQITASAPGAAGTTVKQTNQVTVNVTAEDPDKAAEKMKKAVNEVLTDQNANAFNAANKGSK